MRHCLPGVIAPRFHPRRTSSLIKRTKNLFYSLFLADLHIVSQEFQRFIQQKKRHGIEWQFIRNVEVFEMTVRV